MTPRPAGTIETERGPVAVSLDGDPGARVLLVLAPGAGGGKDSEFMSAIAEGIASREVQVCRFDFPYTEAGRRSPDRREVLEQRYRDVVAGLSEGGARNVVLGGKSLGGRIASYVAMDVGADGLAFLGYPLHPPGKPDAMRADHFPAITVPMLFVEGTRDPFCPLPTLRGVLRAHPARADIVEIQDGDHSFKVRRASGRSTAEAWAEAARAVSAWLLDVVAGDRDRGA